MAITRGRYRSTPVGDVAEVRAAHQLLRRHVGQQLPHRLSFVFGPQVQDGVDDGRGGQVDHAFFRAQPAQASDMIAVVPNDVGIQGASGWRGGDRLITTVR